MVALRAEHGRRLTVRVEDPDGKTVGAALVSVFEAPAGSAGPGPAGQTLGPLVAAEASDNGGAAVFAGLPTGRFIIEARRAREIGAAGAASYYDLLRAHEHRRLSAD